MQISDMLNQYNRTLTNGTEISGKPQGILQTASPLHGMSVGNVFEGSVNHMENGVVTLGLPDGKTIQARLDSGVSVRVGESMFFQVRSNNGAQIEIRPFSGGTGANPTLLNALKAAGLPVNSKMAGMVHTMMEQSMSIDKQSLMNMARLVMGSGGMDASSVVQMVKLGIPVTEEMVAQFENYKFDQYAILEQLENVLELLPEQLAGKDMGTDRLLELNRQMLSLLSGEVSVTEEGAADAASGAYGEDGAVVANVLKQTDGQTLELKEPLYQEEQAIIQEASTEDNILHPEETVLKGTGAEAAEETQQTGAGREVLDSGKAIESKPDLLKELLAGKELQQLARQLIEIPELSGNLKLFSDGVINGELTSKEFMQFLEEAFLSQNPEIKKALTGLVSSKEYRTLIRGILERQWLLKPEELKSEHKVSELYERMDRQLGQMEKILKAFGQDTPQLSETASGVRSNIQFMNQLNQIYAYVQMPLKLAGQNAHSELYVYTDKRKKQEKDGELTAFLHLDLDHLGSTDVSIRLAQKKVATNFYLADDISYQVILEHMHILEKRLEEKGYSVKIKVTTQEEKVSLIDDILKQQTPSSGGMVHRYSFDVRA